MKTLVSLLAIALLLAGCAIHTPGGSVVLDPGVKSGGGHCPPGQAKKGNC